MSTFYAKYPQGTGGGSVSPLTTKGDLYGFDTANARIPVGTDGQVLTADSTQALGVKWGSGVGTAYQEIPVGAVDGVNTAFTVSTAVVANSAFELYVDGLIYVQNTEYTIAGTNITMAVAPAIGQTLYAVYSVVSGGGGSNFITAVNDTDNIDLTVGGTTLSANLLMPKTGSRAAPSLITAVVGLAFSGTQYFTKAYIAGNGGAVTVTANPQIAAGSVDGQQLVIQGRSATDTVTLSDGTGLVLNGPWVAGLDNIITLSWDTSSWVEMSRQ